MSKVFKAVGWAALVVGWGIWTLLTSGTSGEEGTEATTDAKDRGEDPHRTAWQKEREDELRAAVEDLYVQLYAVREPREFVRKYKEQIDEIFDEPTLEKKWNKYRDVKVALFGPSQKRRNVA